MKRLGLRQRFPKLADKFLTDAERWLLVQRTLTHWFPVGPYQHVNFKQKLRITAALTRPPYLVFRLRLASKLSIPELPRNFVIRLLASVPSLSFPSSSSSYIEHILSINDLESTLLQLFFYIELLVDFNINLEHLSIILSRILSFT